MVVEVFTYLSAGHLDVMRVVTNDTLIYRRIKSAATNRAEWRIDVRRRIREFPNIGRAFGGGFNRNNLLAFGKSK